MHSRLRARHAIAALAAALLLIAAVEAASANRLSVSEQRFRIVWNPMEIRQFPPERTMRCPVTMEGSFASASFAKVPGQQIAQVTSATSGTCTGGSLTLLTATLPWEIDYRAFVGTLPLITEVFLNFIGVSLRTSFGVACLFRSTTALPVAQIAPLDVHGVIIGLKTEETILLRSNTILCEEQSLSYAGLASVTRPGSATAILMRLI